MKLSFTYIFDPAVALSAFALSAVALPAVALPAVAFPAGFAVLLDHATVPCWACSWLEML